MLVRACSMLVASTAFCACAPTRRSRSCAMTCLRSTSCAAAFGSSCCSLETGSRGEPPPPPPPRHPPTNHPCPPCTCVAPPPHQRIASVTSVTPHQRGASGSTNDRLACLRAAGRGLSLACGRSPRGPVSHAPARMPPPARCKEQAAGCRLQAARWRAAGCIAPGNQLRMGCKTNKLRVASCKLEDAGLALTAGNMLQAAGAWGRLLARYIRYVSYIHSVRYIRYGATPGPPRIV